MVIRRTLLFKISIKYLYLIVAIAVATVIVSNKVFEDSQRHIAYNPVHSLKTKIEHDLADHIQNNLSKTVEADRLELTVRATTDIETMNDLGDYRLEKVEILANRKLLLRNGDSENLNEGIPSILRFGHIQPKQNFFLEQRQHLSMKDRNG